MSASIDVRAVSRNLRRLLAENGLTVRDVQTQLGLESSQAVYKWLTGKALPTTQHLFALSRLLHTTMENILTGDGQDVPASGRKMPCPRPCPRNTSTSRTYSTPRPVALNAACS